MANQNMHVGLMLLRSTGGGRDRDRANLQMLLISNCKGELSLPEGKRDYHESDLAVAERVVEERLGVGPADYDVFQEFHFVMEDTKKAIEPHKTLYWLAYLKGEIPMKMDPDFTVNWVDFEAIGSKDLLSVGTIGQELATELADFVNKSSKAIHDEIFDNRDYRFK